MNLLGSLYMSEPESELMNADFSLVFLVMPLPLEITVSAVSEDFTDLFLDLVFANVLYIKRLN